MTKLERLQNLLADWGEPDYRYHQICQAVFREGISRFEDIAVLPRQLRQRLAETLGESVLTLEPIRESSSEQADKVLFRLGDGQRIETVCLRYEKGWNSFCVSSQTGCAFACRFCATGSVGKGRNLTAWEILDQLLYFHLAGRKIHSVSFMGMGEPLGNPHLFEALSLLTDPRLLGLSQRRITVSTVGVIPGIRRLTEEWPQVSLAYSLHAPGPALRKRLMPVEGIWPMERVLAALDQHIRRTNKRVFLAYVLLAGVNDGPDHARELARMLRRHGERLPLYHVDLIPYNETDFAGAGFSAPGPRRVRDFLRTLRAAGISCSARTQFGADIGAACGQLRGEEIP